MPVRCLDPDCWKNEVVDYQVTRREIWNHVQKKPKEKLIKILKEYDIVKIDFSILSKWTIYNLFTDLCFVTNTNQVKLLQSKSEGE